MESAAAAIAARCYDDPDFAKQLRADPKAVLERACGKKFPESLAIEVHENDGRTWHLPVPQGESTGKLSDEQLESISGGEVLFVVLAAVFGTLVAGTAAGMVGVAAHYGSQASS